MLPLPLLRARTRKGHIAPVLCSQDEEQLASKMIEEFQAALERKDRKGDLLARVSSYESSFDYKLVRGLYALLERRCFFRSTSQLDSGYVRRMVFEEASKRGFALTGAERDQIIGDVASRIGNSTDELEEALWSDFEENMVLEQFDPIDTKNLIAWYNLSLVQTLLFNCTKVEFYVQGGANWKRVLRDVKRFGLMYNLEDDSGRLVCSLDGPLSLFKMTDRYGTSIAKVLPSLISSEVWYVKAWIVRKTMSGKKIFEFELSNQQSPSFYSPFIEERKMENEIYDSSVEERFASKFEQLANGWKLVREPDPVIAEGKAFIPDFMFEKYGRRVYLEIVGFWTKEYLERKVKKVIGSTGSRIDLLIAVGEELACSKLSSLPKGRVILFRNEVPVKPVIDYLKRIERELVEKSVSEVQMTIDKTKGEVIPIQEIADEYKIPEESASRILSKNDQYVVVGKFLISKMKTNMMEELLKGVTRFADACSVLTENSIPESCHAELIGRLGYDVQWNGLDVNKATIKRR